MSASEVLDSKEPGKWLDVEGRSTGRRQQEELESIWKGKVGVSREAFRREDECKFVDVYLSLKFHRDFHVWCPVGQWKCVAHERL